MDLLIILTIKSKNIKSRTIMSDCLNHFFIFQKKTVFQKTKISKITLLKSPHIHKKSQQHFEQKLHKTNVVFLLNSSTIFLLLKKLIDIIFLDIYISYKYVYNNSKIFNAFFFWFNSFSSYFYMLQNLFLLLLNPLIYLTFNRLKIFVNYLKMTNILGKSFLLLFNKNYLKFFYIKCYI